MNSSDREHPESDDTRLAESKARLDTYRAAKREAAHEEAQTSKHARSKFSMILNELDLRSRKSNQWLTALSLIYVAVVLIVVAVLFSRYSKLERLVDRLEKDLNQTDEAIAEQASHHQKQSQEISGRIDTTGEILDGMSKERESLESQLEEGKMQADQLLRESDDLKTKIAMIDNLLDELSKRAQPFYVHYVIGPDKPQKFEWGKALDVSFEKPKSETVPPTPENAELNGNFFVPTAGTYMVTGWFSTDNQGEPLGEKHVVETEIRVDGIPYWSGYSYGNGVFTSGVPLRAGQIISIHATIRSSDESDSPSGSIERGEIRISRLYYSPE